MGQGGSALLPTGLSLCLVVCQSLCLGHWSGRVAWCYYFAVDIACVANFGVLERISYCFA